MNCIWSITFIICSLVQFQQLLKEDLSRSTHQSKCKELTLRVLIVANLHGDNIVTSSSYAINCPGLSLEVILLSA